MSLPAYKTEFDISISLTIYNTYYFPRSTNREFQLRNLSGDTEEAQIAQARRIMDEVALELHYLTGFGIDKGIVRAGSKKIAETIYPELKPKVDKLDFQALLFQFSQARTYAWTKDNLTKWYISEDEVRSGWQKVIKPVHQTQTLRLPAIVLMQEHNGYMSFFRQFSSLKHKRKRSNYGFSVTYDRNDPVFNRFMNRFQEVGNLAFGDRNYFNAENGYIHIEGRKWPPSKTKPDKIPRKSRLASQPSDNTNYVYIIQAGRTHLYKIGKSNDPQARLDSLQTANPHKLKLLHVFKADNASAAEEELHRLLHHNRQAGEWFMVAPQERAILTAIQRFELNQFWIDGKGINPNELFIFNHD